MFRTRVIALSVLSGCTAAILAWRICRRRATCTIRRFPASPPPTRLDAALTRAIPDTDSEGMDTRDQHSPRPVRLANLDELEPPKLPAEAAAVIDGACDGECVKTRTNKHDDQVNVPFGDLCNKDWLSDDSVPVEALSERSPPDASLSADSPNGAHSGASSSDGSPSSGSLPDGSPSDNSLSNGLLSDSSLSDGPLSNGAQSNGSSADGSFSDGSLSDSSLSDGLLSDGAQPNGAQSNGSSSDGSLSDSSLSDGSLSDGAQPNGAQSNGSSSDGSLSKSSLSAGPRCAGSQADSSRSDGSCAAGPAPRAPLRAINSDTFIVVESDRLEGGKVLGRGGEGVVKRHILQPQGIMVAVKTPHVPSEEALGCLLNEAEAMAAIEEVALAMPEGSAARVGVDNLLTVQGLIAGEPGADGLTVEANNGREFEFVGLLMQEASEGSLYDFITGLSNNATKRSRAAQDISLEVAVRLLRGACSGVAAFHGGLQPGCGFVHADLKMHNLMVTMGDGGELVTMIGDPGHVHAIGEPMPCPWGTRGYQSPEMLSNEGGSMLAHPSHDLHALGRVMAEVLLAVIGTAKATSSKHRTFHAGMTIEDALSELRAHTCEDYMTYEHTAAVKLPPALYTLVSECLQEQPETRPSAADAYVVLSAVAEQMPSKPLSEGDAAAAHS